jgi:hypothetical protein
MRSVGPRDVLKVLKRREKQLFCSEIRIPDGPAPTLPPPLPHEMCKVKRRQNNEVIQTEYGTWQPTTSPVGTVTRVRDGRSGVRIIVRGKDFVFSETSRRLWGSPTLTFNANRVFYPGSKAAGTRS